MNRADIVAQLKARGLLRPSAIALVLSNVVPVFGVLVLGWNVFPIVMLYWLENVVIGFYNVLRMAWCADKTGAGWGYKVFLILFFCVHYGGFCAGHGLFVFALFGGKTFDDPAKMVSGLAWETMVRYQLGWVLLGLIISHGVSFVTNYVRRGEYRRAQLAILMFQPYLRVVILHVSVIMGGFALTFIGSPDYALVLLVFLKIILDLRAHLRERAKLATGPGDLDGPANTIHNLFGRRRSR